MQNVYQLGTDKGERITQVTVLMNASFDNNYLTNLFLPLVLLKSTLFFVRCFLSINFVTRTFLLLLNPSRDVTAET